MTDENQRACDMLSTALDMEKKGKAFYDRAAQNCESEQVKDVFSMLAEQEVAHIERINRLYESLTGGKGWCELEYKDGKHPSIGKVFSEMAKKHGADIKTYTTDVEALETGIDLEARSLKFYRERLDEAGDPMEKEFLEKMAAEEKEHHATLSDLKLYLSDPSSWFSEKERTGLDGA
jgi:rubrerythrin